MTNDKEKVDNFPHSDVAADVWLDPHVLTSLAFLKPTQRALVHAGVDKLRDYIERMRQEEEDQSWSPFVLNGTNYDTEDLKACLRYGWQWYTSRDSMSAAAQKAWFPPMCDLSSDRLRTNKVLNGSWRGLSGMTLCHSPSCKQGLISPYSSNRIYYWRYQHRKALVVEFYTFNPSRKARDQFADLHGEELCVKTAYLGDQEAGTSTNPIRVGLVAPGSWGDAGMNAAEAALLIVNQQVPYAFYGQLRSRLKDIVSAENESTSDYVWGADWEPSPSEEPRISKHHGVPTRLSDAVTLRWHQRRPQASGVAYEEAREHVAKLRKAECSERKAMQSLHAELVELIENAVNARNRTVQHQRDINHHVGNVAKLLTKLTGENE